MNCFHKPTGKQRPKVMFHPLHVYDNKERNAFKNNNQKDKRVRSKVIYKQSKSNLITLPKMCNLG